MEQHTKICQTKDGRSVTLRPVIESDAIDIIQAVQSIIESGVYIQKERPRTEEEEIDFIREVNEKDHMYMAAVLDGRAVGIARVLRGELEMKRHTGLFRTWLTNSAQGQGLGKEMIAYTLDWCRYHKLHKLCLTVFSSNEIAIKLYEKKGFVVEGIQKEQAILNGKYEDEWHMAYFF